MAIDKLDKRLITKRFIAFFATVFLWYGLTLINVMQYLTFLEQIFGEIVANIIIFAGVGTVLWTLVDVID